MVSLLCLSLSGGNIVPVSRAQVEVLAKSAGVQATESARQLEHGVTVERDISDERPHLFRIALSSGQYLKVVVEQKAIDVILVLIGPDSQVLAKVDSLEGTLGNETLSFVASASGDYGLSIQAQGFPRTGGYVIRIDELRSATTADVSRTLAERSVMEGHRLRERGIKDELRKAIEKYQEALARYRQLGDSGGEAEVLWHIGSTYTPLSERTMALESFNGALRVAKANQDLELEAKVMAGMGSVYAANDSERAIYHYSKALEIWRARGHRQYEARTLNDMGWVYKASYKYKNAIDYFKEALSVSQAARQEQLEATSLNNLALTYNDMNEFQHALDCHVRALPLKRAAGDSQGEGAVLNTMGLIYLKLGAYRRAIDFFDRALSVWRRFKLNTPRLEALVTSNIGYTYMRLGEYEKSLDFFNLAAALFRRSTDRPGEVGAQLGISSIQLRLGRYQQAIDHASEALDASRSLQHKSLQAIALGNIASGYYEAGDLDRALDNFRQALSIDRTLENLAGQANTMTGIARIHHARGNTRQARDEMVAVLNILESSRGKVASRDLRGIYFASTRHFYEFFIDVLMTLHEMDPSRRHDVTAFELSGRARARVLVEALNNSQADIRRGADPSLREKEQTLRRLLETKSSQQVRLLGGKHTDEQAAAIRQEIHDLLAQLDETEAQIRSRSPGYAALTQPTSMTLNEVQQQVLDSDTALLEYFLGDSFSYLWLVTKDSMASFRLPGRSVIEKAARRVYDAVVARQQNYVEKRQTTSDTQTADLEYERAAADLSRIVLGPVADRLTAKRLVVVADGALHYIPFAALPSPRLEFEPLITAHEIAMLPSCSTLAALRKERKQAQAPRNIAIFADPVFDRSDSRLKSGFESRRAPAAESNRLASDSSSDSVVTDEAYILRRARDARIVADDLRFPRLVLSRREADYISAAATPQRVMKALDFKASRATVMSPELSQFRVLHFATHGLLDTESPELSAIVLSLIDEHGSPQNGFLRLYEVYNLNLAAELVVLSACQTALGAEVRGEGIVGLARGFMHAGAKRVIASLWKVDDDATAELMRVFYARMLKKGESPTAALRQAQLAIRRVPQWKSPFFWAPFALYGEYR